MLWRVRDGDCGRTAWFQNSIHFGNSGVVVRDMFEDLCGKDCVDCGIAKPVCFQPLIDALRSFESRVSTFQ
jgi:hypothetical protein